MKNTRKGFSLLEMSIVLLVMSMVTGAALSVATKKIESKKVDVTTQHLDLIEEALRQYFRAMGNLPCPADPTLAPTNANYGIEADNPGACTGGSPAAFATAGTPPAVAAMGTVPSKTLQLPDDAMYDGWGRRIDYHVDIRLTELDAETTYPITDITLGAIDIKDADAAAYNITPAQPNGAVVALVSHGPNGHGGFRKIGSTTRISTEGNGADERQNCDCNASGVTGAYNTTLVQHSEVNTGASYYDDVVRYKMRFHFTNPVNTTTLLPSYEGPGLAIGTDLSPFLFSYSINHDTDVFTAMSSPATLPTGQVYDLVFSADGSYIAIATTTAPYLAIYKVNGSELTLLPGQPTTAPTGAGRGVNFSRDGVYLALAHGLDGGGRYIDIFKRDGDVFTKLVGEPAVQPTAPCNGTSFSPDGKFLVCASASGANGYKMIYSRSGDTFIALPTQPNIPPTGNGFNVAWTSDSKYMAISHGITPRLSVYSQTGGVFTKINGGDTGQFTDAASLPNGQGKDVAFSPENVYMAVAMDVGPPCIAIYKHTSPNEFTRLPDPTGGLPGAGQIGYSVEFSKDGNYVALAVNSPPYIYIYKRTGDAFAKLPNPVTLPGSISYAIGFGGNVP